MIAIAAAALLSGCGEDGAGPSSLRFGQVGEIRVTVQAPLQLGVGEVQQVLTWSSSGAWQLFESISYRDVLGDDGFRSNPGTPPEYASSYASLITQLNEVPALSLFVPDLDPDLDPVCDPDESRVTVRIRDDARSEVRAWTRCGRSTLSRLEQGGAGPDPAAGRVLQAAVLARDFTLGDDFRSDYFASVPFGTLDRGETSGASSLNGPRAFVGSGFAVQQEWVRFWADHAGGTVAPTVDWERDMVVVGAVGARQEAGDSVEIRRILPIDQGTIVELFERIPGDFCAPATRDVRPYHIVLAPRTDPEIQFADLRQELVPCGTG